jgi:isoquinoline 1-oxidoreductase subunit alpha
MAIRLEVNGKPHEVDVDPQKPLLWVLREDLHILGPKFGCGMSLCGACTVHVAGEPIRSCVTPVSAVKGPVTTIEGVGQSPVGKRLQQAWLSLDVAQCGYCQPGQIMSAAALLNATPRPTDAQIDAAMDGNLCRCATYTRIRAAIKLASGQSGV